MSKTTSRGLTGDTEVWENGIRIGIVQKNFCSDYYAYPTSGSKLGPFPTEEAAVKALPGGSSDGTSSPWAPGPSPWAPGPSFWDKTKPS